MENNKILSRFFLDYFKPIENIIFLKNNNDNLDLNYRGCLLHSDFNPYEKFIYYDLELLDHLKLKLNNIILNLNPYIAIHVRRTDHCGYDNKYTTDDEFINFINDNNDYKLYIATDNRDTQKKFYNLFNKRIKIINWIKKNNSQFRKTTLEQTILDIYICINSNYFKGSYYSSFSDFIIQMRSHIL